MRRLPRASHKQRVCWSTAASGVVAAFLNNFRFCGFCNVSASMLATQHFGEFRENDNLSAFTKGGALRILALHKSRLVRRLAVSVYIGVVLYGPETFAQDATTEPGTGEPDPAVVAQPDAESMAAASGSESTGASGASSVSGPGGSPSTRNNLDFQADLFTGRFSYGYASKSRRPDKEPSLTSF